MDKKIALVIMLVVIGIQAIHFAAASTYMTWARKYDDANNTPQSRFNSETTKAGYAVAFYVIAAAFSALAYGVALLVQLMNTSIHPKLLHHLNLLTFFCQFTLAVLWSIEVSARISPDSENASVAQKEENYKNFYWIFTADAVLTWVLCVPGSFILAFLNDKEGSSSPVEQKSGTIA